MKLGQLTLFTTLALSAAACASDRSKQVKAAETELTSAQEQAKRDEARLKEKQAKEQAQAQQDTVGERARLQAKQREERMETKQESTEQLAEAREDVGVAHAAMQRERATTEADARDRLQKADTRATNAKTRSSSVAASHRAKFDEAVKLYDTKKAEVEKDIENLKRAPDEKWQEAKKRVDNGLDALERFASRIHDSM